MFKLPPNQIQLLTSLLRSNPKRNTSSPMLAIDLSGEKKAVYRGLRKWSWRKHSSCFCWDLKAAGSTGYLRCPSRLWFAIVWYVETSQVARRFVFLFVCWKGSQVESPINGKVNLSFILCPWTQLQGINQHGKPFYCKNYRATLRNERPSCPGARPRAAGPMPRRQCFGKAATPGIASVSVDHGRLRNILLSRCG